ncbi:MAG: GGDEF domain-containing phosphodiesterase [Pseudomonadota bacterium]
MSTTSVQLPFLQRDGLMRTSRYLGQAVRKSQAIAVLLVHVQNYERLVASVGHILAREILEDYFDRLCKIKRANDAIEQIADRKFAVMVSGLTSKGHATLAAEKIQRIAAETQAKFKLDTPALQPLVGVVMCPEHGDNPHDLLRYAEIACLDGRRRSERICFFEPQTAKQLFSEWGLENRLASAIEAGDLELHYQPKLSMVDHSIVGAEALMRWNEPEIGFISPQVFIDLAEESGQIMELTQFAIQRACRQLSEWVASLPEFSLAVNISPSLVRNSNIVDVIENASGIWGTEPRALTMEVTENALMTDPEASHDVLTQIREIGAKVSIDDFGTGYSSMAYLKRIPADELKIDRAFVMGMLSDDGDYKIVEHSIAIASSFGLEVVAEGIEGKQELDALRELGCDYAQGYYICKPVPASQFIQICREWDGLPEQQSA